jgi:hypothetical protein
MFINNNKLAKTKHLPPGHVDKAKAEKAIKKEYEKCFNIERKWCKRFHYRFCTVANALQFCNEICYSLGERRLKGLVINSPEVGEFAAAHYYNRCIHFKYGFPIYIGTLMHELAHHFECYSHGEKFCEVLDFLFQMAYTKVTGKRPKKDWSYERNQIVA